MIEPVVVEPGEGLFAVAARLAPAGITREQRNQFAMAIAVANGGDFSMVLHPGRILWYDTATIPEPAPAPEPEPPSDWDAMFAARDIAGLDAWYAANTGHDPTVSLREFPGQVAMTESWLTANADGDHIRREGDTWIIERLHVGSIRLSAPKFELRGCHIDGHGAAGDGINTPQGVNPTGIIEDCTFDGGGCTWVGLNFRHATEPDQLIYRRVNVTGYRVGMYIAGGVTAEGCWSHDLHYSAGSHNTAASIRSRNVRLYRNRFADGNSSALSLYAENAPYTGIEIRQNIISTPVAIYEINFPGDKPYQAPQPGETRVCVDNLLERGTVSGRQRFTEFAGNRTWAGEPIA